MHLPQVKFTTYLLNTRVLWRRAKRLSVTEQRSVTIRDIAQQTGLSPATVSIVLNGRSGSASISAATKARVMAAAEQLGYDLGRLRQRRTTPRVVTLFCPEGANPNDPIHYHLILQLSRLLLQHQARTILQPSADAADSSAGIDCLRRGDSDAAIVVAGLGLIHEMGSWGVPAVYIGDVPEGVHVCRVHVDNELGGRLAGQHLWGLGHRRVGVLQVPYGTCAEKRLDAMRAVWRDGGGEIGDDVVVSLDAATYDGLAADLPALLERRKAAGEPLTALFCNSDWMASMAMRVLRDIGLRVPQDMSVVGFDDAHYSELLAPALTTVRQPFAALGALAVELLLEQASAGQPMDKAYVMPCELVMRGSTAPPGGGA